MNRLARFAVVLALALTAVPLGMPDRIESAIALEGAPRIRMGSIERVWGLSLYDTAAAIARRDDTDLSFVKHIVLASAAPNASGDAIAASSLCWAYDAPLLLVDSRFLPEATRSFIADVTTARLASNLSTPTVTVIGGANAVQAPTIDAIASVVGTSSVEQPWLVGDGYETAANIALRAREVALEKPLPTSAFLAVGNNPSTLYDALSAASISRTTGTPILYTAPGALPPSTKHALEALGNPEVITLGGAFAISPSVAAEATSSVRWAGQSLYDTNVETIKGAVARGWINTNEVAVAASIPDGATGAGLIGSRGGALLLTEPQSLNLATGRFLASLAPQPSIAYVFGGSLALSDLQCEELTGKPSTPVIDWNSPPTTTTSSTMRVSGTVTFNAVRATLIVDGWIHSAVPVDTAGRFDFGVIASPSTASDFTVRVESADGQTSFSTSRHVTRTYPYPYSTMIIVDKSDFRLYWIKDQSLVKSYKVSIGKPWTPTPATTWKILRKEYMSSLAAGFGPCRMRLFTSNTAGGWDWSGYLIHGQNSPWTVGTMESAGCIRMYNEDVLELYPQVPIGTMVITRE